MWVGRASWVSYDQPWQNSLWKKTLKGLFWLSAMIINMLAINWRLTKFVLLREEHLHLPSSTWYGTCIYLVASAPQKLGRRGHHCIKTNCIDSYHEREWIRTHMRQTEFLWLVELEDPNICRWSETHFKSQKNWKMVMMMVLICTPFSK